MIRLVFLFCVLFSTSLLADDNWHFASKGTGKNKVCYIYSFPELSKKAKRDEPYIMVTAIDKNTVEFSLSAGYEFKENKVLVYLDSKNKYKLFTKNATAWLKTKEEDKDLVAKMKKTGTLTVESTSKWGNSFKEVYSLYGFSKSYNEMMKTCFKK
jgi:hypothetical protein